MKNKNKKNTNKKKKKNKNKKMKMKNKNKNENKKNTKNKKKKKTKGVSSVHACSPCACLAVQAEQDRLSPAPHTNVFLSPRQDVKARTAR